MEHSQLIALGESDTSFNLISQFLKSVVSYPVKSKLTKEIEAVPTDKEVVVVDKCEVIDDVEE